MAKIRSLQCLRFFAAVLVVQTHALNLTTAAGIGAGWAEGTRFRFLGTAGVDVFFVLSGAIIYQTAFASGRNMPWADFLRRRLIRVAPIYYLVTAVWLVVGVAFLGQHFGPAQFATTLTFWPAWGVAEWPVLAIGWTLCFEMLFYVGAALVLAARRWIPVLAAIFAASWALREPTGWPVFQFLGNPLIVEFLLGVAIMRLRSTSGIPVPLSLAILGLGMVLVLSVNAPPGFYDLRNAVTGEASGHRLLLFGFPAALIVMGAMGLERFVRGKVADLLVHLGDASYSLYLTHWVLFKAAVPVTQGTTLPADLVILIAVAAAVLLSVGVYRFIERPMLRAFSTGKARTILAPTT